MTATASAPGKILWLGGYSVLEKGSVAYVMAVNKRCFATAQALESEVIEVHAPQLNASARFAVGEASKCLQATTFAASAAETTLNYLREKGYHTKGVRVQTRSDEAFASGAGKSGLGASAAVTVATVAAVLKEHGLKPVLQLVHNISQYAHSTAQGKTGSGFDVACSVYGSCVYSRYPPEEIEDKQPTAALFERRWYCRIEKLTLPAMLLPAFANIAGESAGTVEMVRKVMEWKKANESDYAQLVEQLDEANESAIKALKKAGTGNQAHLADFKRFFELGRRLARKLGELSGAAIEPPALRKLVDESLKNGAFCAKLPGAGGGDAIAALCLSTSEAKRLQNFWRGYEEKKLAAIALHEEGDGLRMEA